MSTPVTPEPATAPAPTSSLSPSEATNTKGGIKIESGDIAKVYREEIRRKVAHLKANQIEPPLLVGLLANNDPAAVKYAEWTGRACRSDGLRYDLRRISDPIDVEQALVDANQDPRVHGIIVYYPIFGMTKSFSGESHDDFLRDTISIKCDVEGLSHGYRTNLYRNVRYLDYPRDTQKCLLPCTALSVVKILESVSSKYNPKLPLGRRMEGQTVTVINRSEIVGRPLAAMLANDGASVYSIDIDSIYLFKAGDRRLHPCPDTVTAESCVRQSSVVITGVPTKAYRLPTAWVQPNTTVVNVASFKNVDEVELLKIPGVVYCPMVGKVTVAMLERNLMRLFENFHHPNKVVAREEQSLVDVREEKAWYQNPLQIYTAAVVTALVAMNLFKK